jgi:hypothetical protein
MKHVQIDLPDTLRLLSLMRLSCKKPYNAAQPLPLPGPQKGLTVQVNPGTKLDIFLYSKGWGNGTILRRESSSIIDEFKIEHRFDGLQIKYVANK